MSETNPYAPPVDAAPPELHGLGDLDSEIVATRANGLVKAAIATTAGTGGLLLLCSMYFGWGALLWRVPAALPLIVLGLVEVWLSLKIYRQRTWAAAAAVALSVVVAGISLVWLVVLMMSGFFALMNVALPLVALASALCSGLAIASCARTTKLRRHLASQGLDIDF